MTIKAWSNFKEGGFVFANYFLLQTLDTLTAIVLCQLIAEYNFADNKELTHFQFFLTNVKRLTDVLGITKDELFDSLNYLVELKLLVFQKAYISDTLLIRINEESIIQLLQDARKDALYVEWDWELKETQNPTNLSNTFCPIVQQIIVILQNRAKIPMLFYSMINILILEREAENILKLSDDFIYKLIDCTKNSKFQPMDLFFFIKHELDSLEEANLNIFNPSPDNA